MADEQEQTGNSKDWRALEAKAKRAEAAEQRVAELERRIAFMDSGIKVTEGVGELIAKTYDGELDVEAIREYAKRYGYPFDGGPERDEAQEQRVETGGRIDSTMRAAETTAQGRGSMPRSEWLKLLETDRAKADAAWEAGMVEGTSNATGMAYR